MLIYKQLACQGRGDTSKKGSRKYMQSDANTVEEYLESLPDDRREALTTMREVIVQNLPAGYEEGMQYGMIGYYVPSAAARTPITVSRSATWRWPHRRTTSHCTCLTSTQTLPPKRGSAKNTPGQAENRTWARAVVRFRKLADVPLELVGETVALTPVDDFVEQYQRSRS